jgi:uncharacterized protein
MDIRLATSDFKKSIENLYGQSLYKLVLFGSFARGDFDDDSDIDILQVLENENIRPFQEIDKITPIVSSYLDKYQRFFSIVPVSRSNYEKHNFPLYKNIRLEGIEI